MRKLVYLFAEDSGHELFLTALIQRFAREYGISVKIEPRSVIGGHGKMLTELKEFVRELETGYGSLPDLFLIVRDANCEGVEKRKKEIVRKLGSFRNLSVFAIPDPHIERWMLLDLVAFEDVYGKKCSAPDQKCDRGRYKHLLLEALQQAGSPPLLHAFERADEIVDKMDLRKIELVDESLGKFLKDLRSTFKQWSQT